MSIHRQDDDKAVKLISDLANQLYRQDFNLEPRGKPVENPKADSDTRQGQTSSGEYYFLPLAIDDGSPFRQKTGFDVASIRRDFPILQRKINGKPLVWLDNSATTQKPQCVIDELSRYYSEYNSNVHRGAHTLSQLASDTYEKAREKVQGFIGASSSQEIIFVRSTTEAINLAAEGYGAMAIQPGDDVILTTMEHHSNIVPWQRLKQERGAVIKVIPINDRGEVILEEYARLLSHRTRIVAITHVSNVLGTVNPRGNYDSNGPLLWSQGFN